ncbi:MAG: phage tail protein [Pseudogulbenkiania sp.]|nr:phage tail protein [Pseudogulbenkiania sp.]
MAITLSTGLTASVAKTYGTSVAMSAITNASEAVATLAAGHSVVVGDYLEVTSGWGRLDKRIVRVKTVVTNDVTFESINTSSTAKYPSGAGTGSIRRITAWTQLTLVRSLSATGGDQQFADTTAIDDVVARQIPTIRNAVTMTMDVYDDPTLGWYADVDTADASRTPFGLLMTFPNSSKLVANAYWSLQKVPTMAQNEALMTQISLSYAAEPVRYAS